MKNHRTIIISVEQLTIIKELLDTNYFEGEEIELLSAMIKTTIETKEDIIHGFCY
jgi:hypothetical protein